MRTAVIVAALCLVFVAGSLAKASKQEKREENQDRFFKERVVVRGDSSLTDDLKGLFTSYLSENPQAGEKLAGLKDANGDEAFQILFSLPGFATFFQKFMGLQNKLGSDIISLTGLNGAAGNERKRDILPGVVHNDALQLNILRPFVDFFFGKEDAEEKLNWLDVDKSKPTYCFNTTSEDYSTGPCADDTLPYYGESYVWSLVQPDKDTLAFGTLNDLFCFLLGFSNQGFGIGNVCNDVSFGGSIYVKNLKTGERTDITPKSMKKEKSAARSAACDDKYCVFLAVVQGGSQVRSYVFDKATWDLVYEGKYDEWSDARGSLVVDGRVFFGIATAGHGFGAVVEWLPSKGLGKFRTIGSLNGVTGGIGSLVYLRGRIYGGGWNNFLSEGVASPNLVSAKVVVSPLLSTLGNEYEPDYFSHHWENILDYCEIDPTTACLSAVFGGMAAFKDELHVGTMHLFIADLANAYITYFSSCGSFTPAPLQPYYSDIAYETVFCPPLSFPAFIAVGVTALRSSSHFSIGNAGNDKFGNYFGTYRLLFGSYIYLSPSLFVLSSGYGPKYGLNGYGDFFNAYVWSMAVYNDKLYIGTMDWSRLFNSLIDPFLTTAVNNGLAADLPLINIEFGTPGYDLIVFDGVGRKTISVETRSGHNNAIAYGIRSLVAGKDPAGKDVLFAGTANPFAGETNGGWEIKCLTPKN